MKKRKCSFILLIFTSLYFVIRLLVKIALVDRNYAFVFNGNDLELMLPKYDLLFVLIFFISMYRYFKDVLALRYIAIALAIFFIPFSLFLSVQYHVVKNDQYRVFIGIGAEHLLVIEHIGGLHPDLGDPQDIYLFEKKNSFIYKKIGQSKIRRKGHSLSDHPKLRFENDKPIIEIGEESILLDLRRRTGR